MSVFETEKLERKIFYAWNIERASVCVRVFEHGRNKDVRNKNWCVCVCVEERERERERVSIGERERESLGIRNREVGKKVFCV